MKKILFCTDLTEHSNSALEFSIEIARITHSKIIAVHSYFTPMPLGDGTFPSASIDLDRVNTDQKREVDKICSRIQSYTYEDSSVMECETVVALSHPGQEVLEEANEYDVDLIIMGSRSVPALQRWFGTTSTEVAQKSKKPVLIVPKGAQFSGFRNIVYATDLKEKYTKAVEAIQFGEKFNSKITVLHINNPEEESMDRIHFSIYQERVLEHSEYPLLEFNTITYKDKIPALIEYVKHLGADLLIMNKHHYSFMEKLFRKSVSNEVIFNSEFPVLIFTLK